MLQPGCGEFTVYWSMGLEVLVFTVLEHQYPVWFPFHTITIPNTVLSNEFSSSGSVRVSVRATGSSVGFSIQAGGKALQNIKGLKVEF